MPILDKWKREMEDKLKNIDADKIPSMIKRCPKCNNLSLEYNPNTGRIHCTKCGFEENLPMMR